MSRTTRTVALTAALAAVALAVPVGAAQAATMGFSKSSGTSMQVYWLELGTLPSPVLGNVHEGNMQVEAVGRNGANVFGNITDYQCDEGEVPGGGHGGPTEPGFCDVVGDRFINGGNVTFDYDRKFASATVTGTLNVSGHDGSTLGTPPINMTFTPNGGLMKETSTFTYRDDTGSYTSRMTRTGRPGTPSGRIGPMVFDDAPGEFSYAFLGSFREISRNRSQ